jgi:NAD(P)-dependent dehydrogenase (short-subunit alcohol dehydrogenase family)
LFDLIYRAGLLAGKRILVTGGGSGIGRALATAFAQLGSTVYLAGRRGAVLEDAANELSRGTGALVKGFTCDVRSPEQVTALIDRIWADGGALTGVVNSAAGNFLARTEDISVNAFHTITDIQFRGAYYVTTACGKRWIAEQRRGNVISIVATGVWNGGPFVVPATMAKGGINVMTQSLATEWARYGIRLNAIAPGVFRTEGSATRLDPLDGSAWHPDDNPMSRVGELSEIANVGVFLMSDGLDFLTGQTIAIDGGAYLGNGGTFISLTKLHSTDWEAIREVSRAATDRHKPLRS